MKKVNINPSKQSQYIPSQIKKDIDVIIELADNPLSILEIGTYKGETSHALALEFPEAMIYTVSITNEMNVNISPNEYEFCREGGGDMHNAGLDNIVLNREETGKECRNDGNVVQIYGDSRDPEVWNRIPEVNLIFIDGCHFYRFILNDTLKAMTKKPEVIIWHDCVSHIVFFVEHVVRALRDLEFSIGTIYDVEDSRLAFWRNK